MRRLTRIFAPLVIAVLSSCGGGDSGSGPSPLSITAASPPSGTSGLAYSGYTFAASGGTPPMTWSESGAMPPGMTLSAVGLLSGSPAKAGTYPISISVIDSSLPPLRTSVSVSLKVNDSAIVISLPGTPSAGTVSYPYPSMTFNVSGGSPPYSWTSTGTLPPGLTLRSDGTISGTPTAVGSFSFSVTATDSAQQPTSSPPLPTQIVIGPPPTLALNPTPAPPPGSVGTPYGPFNFTETGGYLPVHWSVAPGSTLPPGLTLGSSDGSLSGTPTMAGTFTPTITVTDSASIAVSQSLPFSITVNLPGPPTINNQEAPAATVGVAYAPYQFTATGGVPPLAWSLVLPATKPLPAGMTLSAQGVLSGTPTAVGMFPITLSVVDALGRPGVGTLATTVRVALPHPPASFTSAGTMIMPRSGHTATLLISGEVLVTGGANGKADATAELYTPGNPGSFSSTKGNMTEARIGHAATLLKLATPAAPNYGKVLIVSTSEAGSSDTTAELYDPASNTFAKTGSMTHARTTPTATLLNTGKVLIVGGNTTPGNQTAELYDPATGTFSDTGSTIIGRNGHTATLLNDGTVLIAGGGGTAIAELYHPADGRFTETTGSFNELLAGNTATLLGAADGTLNGYVLVIDNGGRAYLYDPDPNTQTFEPIGNLPATQNYINHTASLRGDGTVVVTGGTTFLRRFPNCGYMTLSAGGAGLFAPEIEGFIPTGGLLEPRNGQTATALLDGTVLVAGGVHISYQTVSGGPFRPPYCQRTVTVLSSAELFK